MQSFLLAARNGSLSAAARELGVSQPTLSRNIQAIEQQTNLQLFQRTTQGLLLTEAGLRLVEAAEKMDEAANLFHRQVSGLSFELEGDIRISVSEVIGTYLLPPALAAFRALHPGVQIEIDVSNETTSLSKRDADIALRMYRPTQPDLVARRLPDSELGFFASADYIAQNGTPDDIETYKKHSIIGSDRNMEMVQKLNKLGYEFNSYDIDLRTDHLLQQINLARSGAGIVITHVGVARRLPELQRIMEWFPIPPLESWVVCHSDTQYNSRIRELTKFLPEWFASDAYRRTPLI